MCSRMYSEQHGSVEECHSVFGGRGNAMFNVYEELAYGLVFGFHERMNDVANPRHVYVFRSIPAAMSSAARSRGRG